MKLILRNFLSTIRYYRQSSLFNIIGLSLAFMACYIIYVQTTYEFGFGKVHNDYERIHRVNLIMEGNDEAALGASPIITEMNNFPMIESSTIINHLNKLSIEYDTDAGKELLNNKLVGTDTCLNNVFDVEMVLGNFDDIGIGDNAVIPLSMANGVWGDAESAMNKTLYTVYDRTVNIVGVYRDFSKQSVLENYVYFAPKIDNNPFGFNYTHYFKVSKTSTDSDITNMLEEIRNSKAFESALKIMDFTLGYTPLSNIYFENLSYINHPTGNKLVSTSLIFVAFVILLIALVNFVNFSIAIAPRRIKAINTYRVLGHSPFGLRVMIVFEAIFTVIISLLISLGLIELISNTQIANLIATDISVLENIDSVIVMFVVALFVGAVTGLYPAIYMTSFVPAMVLNGGKALPKSAHWIRQFLVSFQYIISITMIIVALFINHQTDYVVNKDYGYKIDNTLVVNVSKNASKIKEQLKKYSNIKDVAVSSANLICSNNSYSGYMAEVDGQENMGLYDVMYVGHKYPRVMCFDIFEGEDFIEADESHSDGYKYILFNETAKKAFGLEIGDVIKNNNLKVKGFFRDINHNSLHVPITPFGLIVSTPKRNSMFMIKYDKAENMPTVIDNIKQTFSEINNGEEPIISTASEYRNTSYKKDLDLNTLINWSALIAIFIAVIGVVGLISLESQQRIREIAIRKVNGATTFEILQMLNIKFIKIVLISYAIALPIAWFVVDSWLSGFEYRVEMSPWIFILSGVGVAVLTIVLVTLQSYRAATTNPSQAMKY